MNDGSLSRMALGEASLFDDSRGGLAVIDIVHHAPFAPVRMFWISDVPAGQVRGGHAHRQCSQFMVCLSGEIRVDAFDGVSQRNFTLKRGAFANLPPGIYATQEFCVDGSVLLVLCDRPYEADDYITDRRLLPLAVKDQPGN